MVMPMHPISVRPPAMKVAAGSSYRSSSAKPSATWNVWDRGPWEPWFAWKPVKTISKKRVWLKRIYRRHSYWDMGRGSVERVEYGDLFDVISADYS